MAYESGAECDDAAGERIIAMRLVEASSTYQCTGYLGECDSSSSRPTPAGGDSSKPADISCRAQMIDWMYSIVDHCGFDGDTVSVAASFADRFLSRRSDEVKRAIGERGQFQLVYMTSLHLAVKIREPLQMDGHLLSKLSRGRYTARQFLDCEQRLLHALDWRLSCPTKMEFIREFLSLLPRRGGICASAVEAALLGNARRLSELSTSEYKLISAKPSVAALAIILELVEGMSYRIFPSEQRLEFFSALEVASGTCVASAEVSAAMLCLQEAYIEANHKKQCMSPLQQARKSVYVMESVAKDDTELSVEFSPFCVSRLSFSRATAARPI